VSDLGDVLGAEFNARRLGKPMEMTPELEAQLKRICERKEREEAMLAKMTPSQREAWIAQWAKGIAEQEVQKGIELDRWLNAGGMGGHAGPMPPF